MAEIDLADTDLGLEMKIWRGSEGGQALRQAKEGAGGNSAEGGVLQKAAAGQGRTHEDSPFRGGFGFSGQQFSF
jgi:hypothetical protein